MAKLIQVFPLSIYKASLELEASYRSQLERRILAARTESLDANKREQSAWLGDTAGHEFLFQQPEFGYLFQQIGQHIRAYVEMLGIASELMHFYYQRAWATVSQEGERIHEHRHEQSNLSVAYYLSKGPEAGNVYFTTEHPPNEFSPGMFSPSKQALGFIRRPSLHTWNLVTLDVAEGDLVIFPSKTLHGTEPNRAAAPRISISADISVMLRESTGHETMMPHFSHWRALDEF